MIEKERRPPIKQKLKKIRALLKDFHNSHKIYNGENTH